MKPTKFISVFCVLSLLLSMLVGCAAPDETPDTLHLLTPLTEEMVRFYYDLAPEDEITQKMLNGVTSLTVFRTQALEAAQTEEEFAYINRVLAEAGADPAVYSAEALREKCVIDYCVNPNVTEGDSFASLRYHVYTPGNIHADDFRGFKIGDETVVKAETMALIPARYFETVVRPAWETAWGKEAVFTKQTAANYVYRDMPPGDQTHEWSVSVKSGYTGMQSFYYFDISASSLEYYDMYLRWWVSGLLDHRILETPEIDTSIFDVFPNLTDLKLYGLTEKA